MTPDPDLYEQVTQILIDVLDNLSASNAELEAMADALEAEPQATETNNDTRS